MKQFENDKVTLDAGCAERSCACYSPQFGDTGGVPHYPETVVAQLLDRIAELEKQSKDMQERMIISEEELNHMRSFFGCDPAYYGMKQSEPVAWMYVNNDGECEEISYGVPYIQDPDIQLLYTTPQTKPLSDEEMMQLAEENLGDSFDYDIMWLRMFVRAIEAKVRGEK